jgi:hypothetical protein
LPPIFVACSTKLVENGLLKEQEAEHLVDEIQGAIDEVLSCSASVHPGEFGTEEEEQVLNKIIADAERAA